MKNRLFTVALVASMLFVGIGSQVDAAKPPGQQEALTAALVLGADLHLSRQGTYSVGLGGYCGEAENTWEWNIGSGVTCANQQGIGATGLLAAWERTGDQAYLDGATAAGDTLVARYDALDDTYENRPFSQDVEFLVRLAADSGNDTYATSAAALYARITDNKTAVEWADRYIENRHSLAGWDLASQVRAALGVGETEFASGIAARLVERKADWPGVPLGATDYTMSSYASLLWAFAELKEESFDLYAEEIRDLLLLGQADDGSWDGGDYQTTAYAILGLAANGAAMRAQVGAWVYLRDTQTTDGGWSYPGWGESGEVNSEVLMAFGALELKGVMAGLTDPQPDHGVDIHPFEPAP